MGDADHVQRGAMTEDKLIIEAKAERELGWVARSASWSDDSPSYEVTTYRPKGEAERLLMRIGSGELTVEDVRGIA